MYRPCIIPTRYAPILKTIETQSERCQVFMKLCLQSVRTVVLLYVRMCVRLPTIPFIRVSINFLNNDKESV